MTASIRTAGFSGLVALVLLLSSPAWAANAYWSSCAEGSGCCDSLQYNQVANGDVCFLMLLSDTNAETCMYTYDSDGSDSEGTQTPCKDPLQPQDGIGRWRLNSYGLKSVSIAKTPGQPGRTLNYEANGTDTNATGTEGPANRAGTNLFLKYPDGDPTYSFLVYGIPSSETAQGVWRSFPLDEVDGHASTSLSAAQVRGTILYNLGQAGNVILALPAAAAGYYFKMQIGEQVSYYWRVQAAAGDKIYLAGVAGSDNGYVQHASALVIGAYVECSTFKTDAYDWSCKAGSGTWTAGGP